MLVQQRRPAARTVNCTGLTGDADLNAHELTRTHTRLYIAVDARERKPRDLFSSTRCFVFFLCGTEPEPVYERPTTTVCRTNKVTVGPGSGVLTGMIQVQINIHTKTLHVQSEAAVE